VGAGHFIRLMIKLFICEIIFQSAADVSIEKTQISKTTCCVVIGGVRLVDEEEVVCETISPQFCRGFRRCCDNNWGNIFENPYEIALLSTSLFSSCFPILDKMDEKVPIIDDSIPPSDLGKNDVAHSMQLTM